MIEEHIKEAEANNSVGTITTDSIIRMLRLTKIRNPSKPECFLSPWKYNGVCHREILAEEITRHGGRVYWKDGLAMEDSPEGRKALSTFTSRPTRPMTDVERSEKLEHHSCIGYDHVEIEGTPSDRANRFIHNIISDWLMENFHVANSKCSLLLYSKVLINERTLIFITPMKDEKRLGVMMDDLRRFEAHLNNSTEEPLIAKVTEGHSCKARGFASTDLAREVAWKYSSGIIVNVSPFLNKGINHVITLNEQRTITKEIRIEPGASVTQECTHLICRLVEFNFHDSTIEHIGQFSPLVSTKYIGI